MRMCGRRRGGYGSGRPTGTPLHELVEAGQHGPGWIVRGGRQLVPPSHALLDPDQVREGPAGVDTDAQHGGDYTGVRRRETVTAGRRIMRVAPVARSPLPWEAPRRRSRCGPRTPPAIPR